MELELLVNKQQTRGSWAERAAEAAAPAKTTGCAPCSEHRALSSGCALPRAGCLCRNVPVSEAADHAPLDGRRVGEAEGAALSRKGEPCCPPRAFGAKCRRWNEQARVDLDRAGGALVSATAPHGTQHRVPAALHACPLPPPTAAAAMARAAHDAKHLQPRASARALTVAAAPPAAAHLSAHFLQRITLRRRRLCNRLSTTSH